MIARPLPRGRDPGPTGNVAGMAPAPQPGPAGRWSSGRNNRARAATAAVFLTNGAIFANLLPRYPEVKADLGMSSAVYGAALAALPAGALVAGLTAGALIRRFGSARVAVLGTVGIAVLVLGAGTHPHRSC